jgi:hypothetical protein
MARCNRNDLMRSDARARREKTWTTFFLDLIFSGCFAERRYLLCLCSNPETMGVTVVVSKKELSLPIVSVDEV